MATGTTDGSHDVSEDDRLGEDPWSGLEADWEAVPGTPDWCPSRVRLNPATAERGLRFRPCRGGQAGCVEFAPAGGPLTARRYLFRMSDEPTFLHGKPYFLVRRFYYKRGGFHMPRVSVDTLSSLDGDVAFEHAVFTIGGPPKDGGEWEKLCSSSVGFNDGRVIGSFRAWDSSDRSHPSKTATLWESDLGSAARIVPHPVDRAAFGANGPDRIAFRGSNLFITFLAGTWSTSTALMRLPSWTRASLAPQVAAMRLFHPHPIEGGAIVKGGPDFDSDRIYFMSNEGAVERLWQADAGRSAANVRFDKSNGDHVVWTEADTSGMSGTDWRIWASPLASRESDFAPRCIGKIPFSPGAYSVADRGIAVLTSEDHNVLLVRYADGVAWSLPASSSFKWLDALWVDDTYVWLEASTNVTANNVWWSGNAIVRIERATLGAPTALAPCTSISAAAKVSSSPSHPAAPSTLRTSH